MPCPFFLPIAPVACAPGVRFHLPLIEEYEGHCAARQGAAVEAELRLRACNLGAADMGCPTLREQLGPHPVISRFHLVEMTEAAFSVLVVYEQDGRPVRSQTVAVRLDLPEQNRSPLDEQLRAFCQSARRRRSA